MRIPTESYEKIYQDYSDALEWMKKIGVKFSSGRTNHYEKVVRRWKDEYTLVSGERGKVGFADFVSSMFEVHDFIDIYNAFRDAPYSELTQLVDKLQKGIYGPINASNEKPNSTVARNFLFEATVAAKFHHPQIGVETILNATSDTGIKIGKKKLWVECKRVSTAGKIEANVKKASSQLETVIRRQKGSGHRGIVALDVTKIFYPDDNVYVSNTDSELITSIDRKMDSFIRNYSEIWQDLYRRRDKKIIGTIVRFSYMATSESRNLLVRASQWGMNPRRDISLSDENIQKALASYLKSEI
ncbi:hypothetical protein [Agaribacter marinus]|nr:hypothetical protein [Agaribacter marinus]